MTGQDRTGQVRSGGVYGCVCIEMDGLVYAGRGESETNVEMFT